MDTLTGLCIGGDLDGAWREGGHGFFQHHVVDLAPFIDRTTGGLAQTAGLIKAETYKFLRPGGHLGDKGFWICLEAFPEGIPSPNDIVAILADGYRKPRLQGTPRT